MKKTCKRVVEEGCYVQNISDGSGIQSKAVCKRTDGEGVGDKKKSIHQKEKNDGKKTPKCKNVGGK